MRIPFLVMMVVSLFRRNFHYLQRETLHVVEGMRWKVLLTYLGNAISSRDEQLEISRVTSGKCDTPCKNELHELIRDPFKISVEVFEISNEIASGRDYTIYRKNTRDLAKSWLHSLDISLLWNKHSMDGHKKEMENHFSFFCNYATEFYEKNSNITTKK